MIMMMTCPCPGAGMSWNLDFLSMSIKAGCVSDPGRGTWMVLLSAGILFCWAGSVDEDGIYGYLRGGISRGLDRTFIGKILTVCRRRILQILDGDRNSFLLKRPQLFSTVGRTLLEIL